MCMRPSKRIARLAPVLTAGLMLLLAPTVQAEWLNRILATVSTSGGRDIFNFSASPDSQHVVYYGDAEVNDQYELYSVPTTGGTVENLSDILVPGGDVSARAVLPTDRLLFIADREVDDQTELFSVPYAGGPATKLNGNMIAEGDVAGWRWSADYDYVVYSADQAVDGIYEIYKVPLQGGAASKVNLPLAPGDSVNQWTFSQALEEVVYATQFSSSPGPEVGLYRVPVNGGPVLTLTLPITTGPSSWSVNYSPTGNRLVYSVSSGFTFRLYSSNLDGTDVQTLTVDLSIPNWMFSRDGQKILYPAGNPLALYAVPVTGGSSTKLSDATGGGIIDWKLSLDGSRVVYWGYITNGPIDKGLYSVSIDGGPVTPLHSAPVLLSGTSQFQITPDSTQVVYVGESYKLYVVPITGGTPTPLTAPMSGSFWINASGTAVIFSDDMDTAGTVELYSLPITGGMPEKLNRPLTTNEDVYDFFPTANGRAVIYKVHGNNYVELDVAYLPTSTYLPLIMR